MWIVDSGSHYLVRELKKKIREVKIISLELQLRSPSQQVRAGVESCQGGAWGVVGLGTW